MADCLLGIDIGTTGAKALLVNPDGEVIAEANTAYGMRSPRPGWREQNPEDWWTATAGAIREVIESSGVDPGEIAGVGLTGQMHGLVLLDGRGDVLRPCIMWNDQRAVEECDRLTSDIGADKAFAITGKQILPNFTAPKIAWVRKHEVDLFARAAKVLLPKDYIRFRLTGEHRSDVSDASGTSLFDVGARRWSDDLIAALDIPRSWLPETTESIEVSSRVNADAAGQTGLPQGTPVVGGAGDQAAQAIGTGLAREGIISATLGTSGVLFATTDSCRLCPEGQLHAYCHAVPGKWHLMGVMLSAAGSFHWFRDTLGGGDGYDVLTGEAETVPAGSEGLLFLPYLSGERTPHADPCARGVFFGLTLRHSRAHLTRAVLEGVAYGLRDSLGLMRNLGIPIDEVRVSGGGAASETWLRILADVFAVDLLRVNIDQGAAYGAALLAGVGAGVYADVEEACERTIRVTGRTAPGGDSAVYQDYYPRYRALYPALRSEFAAISRLALKLAREDD